MRLLIASLIVFGMIPTGVHAKPVKYIGSGSSWRYTQKDIPSEQAAAANLNDSKWRYGRTPFSSVKSGPFAMRTHWPENTTFWVRKHINIRYPSALKAYIDVNSSSSYEFYWNGAFVKKSSNSSAFRWQVVIPIPASAVRRGINVVAIRLVNRGGPTTFDMKLFKSTGAVIHELDHETIYSSTGSFIYELDRGTIYNPGNRHFYMYMLTPRGITWADANTIAAQTRYAGMQGHLATITSANENTFILKNLPDKSYTFWLGGFQPSGSKDPDGGWRWVTPEKWSYTNWARREPSNGENRENTLELRPDGLWNDRYEEESNSRIGYIIEFEPSKR